MNLHRSHRLLRVATGAGIAAAVVTIGLPVEAADLEPHQQTLVLLVELALAGVTVAGGIIFYLMFRDILRWRPRVQRAPDRSDG